MDGLEIRQILPERDVFEVGGLTIGLCHGRGASNKVLDIVKEEFKKDKVDVVVFGHSHQSMNEIIDGVLDYVDTLTGR